MTYPGNYGFFPNTLAGDGDPLDALLITNYPILPGTHVQVRIIGALLTEDEKGQDEKIIVVPIDTIDKHFTDINNYTDLEQIYLDKIEHFFKHYKHLEKDKWVRVSGYVDATTAISIYHQSLQNFSKGEMAKT
jgi:inorganic pyrophosphatase